jgi:sulfide:quinone oxidoreductase
MSFGGGRLSAKLARFPCAQSAVTTEDLRYLGQMPSPPQILIVCHMERFGRSPSCPHVVIVGGGFAGAEALLALLALGGEHVRVTLVAPEPTLFYRPAATAEAFEDRPMRSYDLGAIVSDLGAAFVKARLDAVGSRKQYLRLSSGVRLTYDALILATGGRATASVAGAMMFRDQRDVPAFRRLLAEMDSEVIHRVAFALPGGTSWPLPLYELALLSARRAADRGLSTQITLVTPEPAPLAMFGAEPSRMMASVLSDQGVAFVGGSIPDHVRDDGSLGLRSGSTIEAERVVAVPQLRGRPIPGVPTDRAGFVPTDGLGQVQGLRNVYAAGDLTSFPVKQGGIAAQQADRVAQAVLIATGVRITPRRIPSVLQARLVGGQRTMFLRAELDERGQPTSATLTRVDPSESVVDKVLARYLTPYLEGLQVAAPVHS